MAPKKTPKAKTRAPKDDAALDDAALDEAIIEGDFSEAESASGGAKETAAQLSDAPQQASDAPKQARSLGAVLAVGIAVCALGLSAVTLFEQRAYKTAQEEALNSRIGDAIAPLSEQRDEIEALRNIIKAQAEELANIRQALPKIRAEIMAEIMAEITAGAGGAKAEAIVALLLWQSISARADAAHFAPVIDALKGAPSHPSLQTFWQDYQTLNPQELLSQGRSLLGEIGGMPAADAGDIGDIGDIGDEARDLHDTPLSSGLLQGAKDWFAGLIKLKALDEAQVTAEVTADSPSLSQPQVTDDAMARSPALVVGILDEGSLDELYRASLDYEDKRLVPWREKIEAVRALEGRLLDLITGLLAQKGDAS